MHVDKNLLTQRAKWMGTLAKAAPDELRSAARRLTGLPGYEALRKPETGLVMVRGRMGGTGRAFNLGEMTMTRCAVRVENGHAGFGYVAGRNAWHAELAAYLDALLQDERFREDVMSGVIAPLEERRNQDRALRRAETLATKVDFFTMVRGEDNDA
jgi:alpha-D-ribose 1-methylphosphonate 5-triphosphate synthase subunit PhnG